MHNTFFKTYNSDEFKRDFSPYNILKILSRGGRIGVW